MKQGVSLESARAAKARAAEVIAPLVGEEVAVGITKLSDDCFGLKVNLTNDPGEDVRLPDEVEGVPLLVEVTGKIHKR